MEFHTVRSTPTLVMSLVRRCTDGAVEWAEEHQHGNGKRPLRVVRKGDALYHEGRLDFEVGTTTTAAAVLDAAHAWWSAELAKAETFLQSDGWGRQEFGKGRPSLREVLEALERLGEGSGAPEMEAGA